MALMALLQFLSERAIAEFSATPRTSVRRTHADFSEQARRISQRRTASKKKNFAARLKSHHEVAAQAAHKPAHFEHAQCRQNLRRCKLALRNDLIDRRRFCRHGFQDFPF
jgi:hypothetical protein